MVPIKDLSPKRLKELRGDHIHKYIEAIITADGTYYPCITSHQSLITYLKNIGVNLRGAMRIDQGYRGEILISTCYGYRDLDENVANDKVIWITKEQARTFITFFSCLKEIEKEKYHTVRKLLEASKGGFGWFINESAANDPVYYSNNIAEANIDAIQDAIIERFPNYGQRADLDLEEFREIVRDSNNKMRPAAREIKEAMDRAKNSTPVM